MTATYDEATGAAVCGVDGLPMETLLPGMAGGSGFCQQSVHRLSKEYELGGIAEWVLGNQQDWVWEIISANIA